MWTCSVPDLALPVRPLKGQSMALQMTPRSGHLSHVVWTEGRAKAAPDAGHPHLLDARKRPAGALQQGVEPAGGQMTPRSGHLSHVVWTEQVHMAPKADGTLIVGATVEAVGLRGHVDLLGPDDVGEVTAARRHLQRHRLAFEHGPEGRRHADRRRHRGGDRLRPPPHRRRALRPADLLGPDDVGEVTAARRHLQRHRLAFERAHRQGEMAGTTVLASGAWAGEGGLIPDLALPVRPLKGQSMARRAPSSRA
jgi:hypothetical protein